MARSEIGLLEPRVIEVVAEMRDVLPVADEGDRLLGAGHGDVEEAAALDLAVFPGDPDVVGLALGAGEVHKFDTHDDDMVELEALGRLDGRDLDAVVTEVEQLVGREDGGLSQILRAHPSTRAMGIDMRESTG